MPGGKRYPAGPLAYIALGLFVMTWASIRMWRPPMGAAAARRDPTTDVARFAGTFAAPTRRAEITIATSVTPPPDPSATTAPQKTLPAALVMEELASMPMVAEIAPPVATRIELDPVLSLEPEFELAMAPALVPSTAGQLPPMAASDAPQPRDLNVRIARVPSDIAPRIAHAWPYPQALVAGLQGYEASPEAQAWSRQVLAEIERLFAADALASAAAEAALTELERLSDEARNIGSVAPQDRAQIARASFGLVRRLLVWRQVAKVSGQPQPVAAIDHDETLRARIDAVERHFAGAPTWPKFLLLSQLRGSLEKSTAEQANLARRVLHRLESPDLTDAQHVQLAKSPVSDLTRALKTLAAEPVDLTAVLAALEELELGDNSVAAQQVALAWQRLRWSNDAETVQLAEYVNTYYRNANVRVAISGELLNMLMPQQRAVDEPVDDEILGARVYGRSQTNARLRVVLLPDKRRLRLGLEAIGEVDSDTAATKGPATLYTQGTAHFHARKMLQIDRQGLRVWRSQAEVDTNSQLTDIATDFDALPFVGMFARAMARQEHDEMHHEANHQVRGRVAARAEHRLDSEVHKQLADAEREFLEQIYQPLQKLRLDPTAVDLHTTREQLIARYRIAGQHQLAAYTPRPAAPDDSVLNIQMHQSTLNNVLEQLALDGRRTDLESLYRDMAKAFNQTVPQATLDELPERVTIQFAERDAVRVHCDGGKMLLVIKIAELSQGRERKWKNFTVQAYYAPQFDSLEAKLAREGTIELIGERLNFRDQIALRAIFTKVLSKDRAFNLVSAKLAHDPRLKALSIGQFTIEDGWIGLAVVGPKPGKPRVAGQQRGRK